MVLSTVAELGLISSCFICNKLVQQRKPPNGKPALEMLLLQSRRRRKRNRSEVSQVLESMTQCRVNLFDHSYTSFNYILWNWMFRLLLMIYICLIYTVATQCLVMRLSGGLFDSQNRIRFLSVDAWLAFSASNYRCVSVKSNMLWWLQTIHVTNIELSSLRWKRPDQTEKENCASESYNSKNP